MSVLTGRRALRATAADQMCGIDARQAHQAAAAITVNLAALAGGRGSYLGAVIGALLLFGLQQVFGDFGAWYLAGIGVVATLFSCRKDWLGIGHKKVGSEPLSMRRVLAMNPQGE